MHGLSWHVSNALYWIREGGTWPVRIVDVRLVPVGEKGACGCNEGDEGEERAGQGVGYCGHGELRLERMEYFLVLSCFFCFLRSFVYLYVSMRILLVLNNSDILRDRDDLPDTMDDGGLRHLSITGHTFLSSCGLQSLRRWRKCVLRPEMVWPAVEGTRRKVLLILSMSIALSCFILVVQVGIRLTDYHFVIWQLYHHDIDHTKEQLSRRSGESGCRMYF